MKTRLPLLLAVSLLLQQHAFADKRVPIQPMDPAEARKFIKEHPEQLGGAEDQPFTPVEYNLPPNNTLPFKVAVVNGPDTQQKQAISAKARALFQEKNYDALEAMAAEYRKSKEGYADGMRKLDTVYGALNILETSTNERFLAQIIALKDWVKAKPASLTAKIALADVLIGYAWKARGSGTADTVTDENARRFSDRLQQANEILKDAKALDEKCPHYWRSLLTIDMGLGTARDQANADFRDATEFDPEYVCAYAARALFLLPRWYGQQGEWEKELATSADKLGGDKGDMLYAQVVWHLHRSHTFQPDIFSEHRISWPRIDKGFNVIVHQFPDSLAAKNEHAYLAAVADDPMAARKYFDQTQGKADLSVW
ncbi:MAG TPA: hypothetical protein VN625_00530, partial [Desulfuromonadaceae bacterium]|nr:hypothetical protein [Desulfuromonadaceae bacterium]